MHVYRFYIIPYRTASHCIASHRMSHNTSYRAAPHIALHTPHRKTQFSFRHICAGAESQRIASRITLHRIANHNPSPHSVLHRRRSRYMCTDSRRRYYRIRKNLPFWRRRRGGRVFGVGPGVVVGRVHRVGVEASSPDFSGESFVFRRLRGGVEEAAAVGRVHQGLSGCIWVHGSNPNPGPILRAAAIRIRVQSFGRLYPGPILRAAAKESKNWSRADNQPTK